MPKDIPERLNKVLAHAGIASRRRAETMIEEGRVTVNGQVVTELGTKVDPDHDDIRVDGERIKAAASHVYLMVNKPRGVLSVMQDDRGRRSLGDLVPHEGRLYPVGRLDVNSEGLILLTDDGELANVLTHPRYQHEKEYRVLVNGHPGEKTLDAWRRGVVLEGQRTAPAEVEILRRDREGVLLRVVMHEGRKRQIRDVAALLGHPVRELRRVRIGPLQLGILESGQWRPLTPSEVKEVQALTRVPARKGRKGVGEHGRKQTQPAVAGQEGPAGRSRSQRPPGRVIRHGAPALAIRAASPDRGPRERNRPEGPPEKGRGQGPSQRGRREGPAEKGYRQGPPERGRREGPPEKGRSQSRPERGPREGPPEKGRRQGPPERGRRQGPPEKGRGQGPPERGRYEGPREKSHRQGSPERGRRGGPPEQRRRQGPPDKKKRGGS